MCSFCFPLPSDFGAFSDGPQLEAPSVFPSHVAFEPPAPHASPPFSFPFALFSPHPALAPDPQVGATTPHPSPDELAPQVAAPEPPRLSSGFVPESQVDLALSLALDDEASG